MGGRPISGTVIFAMCEMESRHARTIRYLVGFHSHAPATTITAVKILACDMGRSTRARLKIDNHRIDLTGA